MVEDLGVIVAHHGQQRALGTGRNTVVFVDDLDPHAKPGSPRDADVVDALRAITDRRERIAKQIGDRHLRMTVLHGRDAHREPDTPQERPSELRLPSCRARTTDEQTFAACRKRQQRQQHETRIALSRRERAAALRIFQDKRLGRLVVVLDVIMGADNCGVDYPEVCLAKLLVQRLIGSIGCGGCITYRSSVQVEATSKVRGICVPCGLVGDWETR